MSLEFHVTVINPDSRFYGHDGVAVGVRLGSVDVVLDRESGGPVTFTRAELDLTDNHL